MSLALRLRRRALPLGLVAAVVATFFAISPVMADTELARSGRIGVGSVREGNRDVTCNYEKTSGDLEFIDIAGPTIYARNRTAGVDNQTVGSQLIVKRSKPGSPTKTFKTSIVKMSSSDSTPAYFPSRTFTVNSTPANATFIVIVKMLWYKADGTTVAGWSKHRVDMYTTQTPGNEDQNYPVNRCHSFLF